jgi:hypothetical protein
MARILNKLSDEDLTRWRMCMADKELADLSFTGLSVQEGRSAYVNYYRTLNSLLTEYGVDMDTLTGNANIMVSPITGHIVMFEE